MTTVLDVDLLDETWEPPLGFGATRLLVWAGGEVLGETTIGELDAAAARQLRQRLLEQFAPRLIARRAVAVEPVATPTPDELSIVVCTRDRPAYLEGALEALRALDPAPREVLVVDNASTTDATAALARRYGVRRVVEPQPGLDRARNRGWQEARGALVAYVDDDARPHRRYARAITAAFLDDAVGGVTGLVVPAELLTPAQRRFEHWGGMRKGYERRVFADRANPVGLRGYLVGVGTNMAFRRALLAELGGFDPRLDVGTATRGGGDLDMFIRALWSGAAIVYEPNAVVRHIHRRDRAGLRAQMRDNGVAFSALLAKYEADPETAALARRERARWHRDAHVRGLLRALERRELTRALGVLEELKGSRHGAAALAVETAKVAASQACAGAAPSDRSAG